MGSAKTTKKPIKTSDNKTTFLSVLCNVSAATSNAPLADSCDKYGNAAWPAA